MIGGYLLILVLNVKLVKDIFYFCGYCVSYARTELILTL